MLSWLPEGQSGSWKVEHFEISESQSRFSFFSYGSRSPDSGRYTRLVYGRDVIMSDTYAELRDLSVFKWKVTGSVLINGLGLGVAAKFALDEETVSDVTVIELSQDVIDLVGVYLLGMYEDRLQIIHADALTWEPPKGKRWDVVWHDIWDNICTDNWNQYKLLHRKYGKRCNWQGSWARPEMEAKIRQERYLHY